MNIIANCELFIFDIDGVIVLGNDTIQSAIDFINHLQKIEKKIAFYTNNATKSRVECYNKILKLGIKCKLEDVFTSSYIASQYFSKIENIKNLSCYVVGTDSLKEQIKESGINLLNEQYSDKDIIRNNIKADSVIAGLDPTMSYDKLSAATLLLHRGSEFYATNNDATYPSEFGNIPGAGSIVSFLSTTSGRTPKKIFGKPSPEGINIILNEKNIHQDKAVMIGDRLDTDILCGINAKVNTCLVLTGISTRSTVSESPLIPDVITPNLLELIEI